MTARRHLRVQLGDAYRQRMLEVALREGRDQLQRECGRVRHGRAALRPRWRRRRRRAAAARRRLSRPGRLYVDLLRAIQPALDRIRRALRATAEAAARAQERRDAMVRDALGLGDLTTEEERRRLMLGRHLVPTILPGVGRGVVTSLA